jgi:hypothetical protein
MLNSFCCFSTSLRAKPVALLSVCKWAEVILERSFTAQQSLMSHSTDNGDASQTVCAYKLFGLQLRSKSETLQQAGLWYLAALAKLGLDPVLFHGSWSWWSVNLIITYRWELQGEAAVLIPVIGEILNVHLSLPAVGNQNQAPECALSYHLRSRRPEVTNFCLFMRDL